MSKLTEQEQLFLEYLFQEAAGDVRAAMSLAGYPKSQTITSLLSKLHDEVIQKAREYLVGHTPEAVIKMIGVMRDPSTPGTPNLLKAAQEIMDRAGLVKEEKVAVTSGGVVFLPEKRKPNDSESGTMAE